MLLFSRHGDAARALVIETFARNAAVKTEGGETKGGEHAFQIMLGV
jgi:hypothetical protein